MHSQEEKEAHGSECPNLIAFAVFSTFSLPKDQIQPKRAEVGFNIFPMPCILNKSFMCLEGFLVKDFLTGDDAAESYLQKVAEDRESYNGFHSVCIESWLAQTSVLISILIIYCLPL
jgi:hypothetical protein